MQRFLAVGVLSAVACGGTKTIDGSEECVMQVDINRRGQTQNVPPSNQPLGFIMLGAGDGLDGCPYVLTATPPLDENNDPNPLPDLYLQISFGDGGITAPVAYVDIGRGVAFEMHGTSLNVSVVNESGKMANGVSVFISDGIAPNGKPQGTVNGLNAGADVSDVNLIAPYQDSDKQVIPFYAQSVQVAALGDVPFGTPQWDLIFYDSDDNVIVGYNETSAQVQIVSIPANAKTVQIANTAAVANITGLSYVFDLGL